MAPLLGFIEPPKRNRDQADAHQMAVSRMMASANLAPVTLQPGQKIILNTALKNPDVIKDMGMEFTGFHQQTGSCVGVTLGEVIALLSAIQRTLSDPALVTKAFIPWWPYTYGRTRFNEGDRGQGEGAVSSVAGDTLDKEGTFAPAEAQGLPQFDTSDGLSITAQTEYKWSDGGSQLVSQYVPLGSTHSSNAKTVVRTAQDAVTMIANGYPVANGCAYYVGGGSIRGSGDTAYIRGRYDGRGGHETEMIGVWNHPNDGLLFLYWNHWPKSTYANGVPDPAGGPRCSVWVPEAEFTRMLNAGWSGINDGEAWSVSHLDYFPAQVDKIMQWTGMWS